MRKIKIKKYVPIQFEEGKPQMELYRIKGTGCMSKEFTKDANFLAFGVSYEHINSGNGTSMIAQFTVAIIELPDGTIKEEYIYNIKFINI